MFVAHKTVTIMGELKRMDQIRYILETFLDTGSYKGTAWRLKVSKNTVREYARRVTGKYEDISEAFNLSEEEFLRLAYCIGTDVPKNPGKL